ncbi:unnamed protein product [Closterium sp. NIES-54]
MGTKEAFVDLQPSGNVKHVLGFNGALQDVMGRGTVALQGEAGKQVLIPYMLYVPGVHANLLSAGQLKENGVKLQDDVHGMLLTSVVGDVLACAVASASSDRAIFAWPSASRAATAAVAGPPADGGPPQMESLRVS